MIGREFMKKKEGILLFIIICIDLITKYVIQTNMKLYESITVIEDFFSITYAQNTGAAWSMLEGKMLFFVVTTIIALIFLTRWLYSTNKNFRLTRISLTLMIAGSLGNFYDRLVFGYVRDFIDFNIFGYDFPIFNIADMSLCIGVALLIFIIIFNKEDIKL